MLQCDHQASVETRIDASTVPSNGALELASKIKLFLFQHIGKRNAGIVWMLHL